MALWESLSNAEREAELEVTTEDVAELDRRWADHVQRPESAIPWDDVRRKLVGALGLAPRSHPRRWQSRA